MPDIKFKPWGVQFLPAIEGNPEKRYRTHLQVVKAVQTKLDDLGVWCSRYNGAGKVALDDVRREVNELKGDFDIAGGEDSPGFRSLSGVFDEHAGMAVRIHIRRLAEPK